MYDFASIPRGVWALTAARNISPVDIWTTLYFSTISSHCVPFPDAGAPEMRIWGFADVAMVRVVGEVDGVTRGARGDGDKAWIQDKDVGGGV